MNNLQIVQDAYGKFGSGDVAGLIGLLSDDVDWRVPEIENASFAGARRGHQAMVEFFTALVTEEDITQFEPTEFIDGGDKIVVLGKSAATVRETGRSYQTDWVHIFTIKDGKITNFHEFFDNAAATRAYQKTTTA